jgi:hypothetical protein
MSSGEAIQRNSEAKSRRSTLVIAELSIPSIGADARQQDFAFFGRQVRQVLLDQAAIMKPVLIAVELMAL